MKNFTIVIFSGTTPPPKRAYEKYSKIDEPINQCNNHKSGANAFFRTFFRPPFYVTLRPLNGILFPFLSLLCSIFILLLDTKKIWQIFHNLLQGFFLVWVIISNIQQSLVHGNLSFKLDQYVLYHLNKRVFGKMEIF